MVLSSTTNGDRFFFFREATYSTRRFIQINRLAFPFFNISISSRRQAHTHTLYARVSLCKLLTWRSHEIIEIRYFFLVSHTFTSYANSTRIINHKPSTRKKTPPTAWVDFNLFVYRPIWFRLYFRRPVQTLSAGYYVPLFILSRRLRGHPRPGASVIFVPAFRSAGIISSCYWIIRIIFGYSLSRQRTNRSELE